MIKKVRIVIYILCLLGLSYCLYIVIPGMAPSSVACWPDPCPEPRITTEQAVEYEFLCIIGIIIFIGFIIYTISKINKLKK